MTRRKIPRLAAAFVVTVAAGCGEAPTEPVTPENPPVSTQIIKQPDGSCVVMMFANPPYSQPTPCPGELAPPIVTATATAPTTATPNLPAAPAGWRVSKHADGTCTAYGPDPCNHPGCNPPPPRAVACPADLKDSP